MCSVIFPGTSCFGRLRQCGDGWSLTIQKFVVLRVMSFFGPPGCGCYFLSSMLANENNTDDISDWYGTCWASASSLILSKIGRGIRMFITQSDLLKALYAAYSRNRDSMFIINNCCITFGIGKPPYKPQYRGLYNALYQCKYNCQYKYIYVYIYVCLYDCGGGCKSC